MTYAVLHRCGMNPDMYMDSEDFQPIVEFNTPEFHLWQCDKEQVDAALREAYGIETGETFSKIESVSVTLAAEYWTEHKRDIADIIAESFLEECGSR